MTPLQAVKLLLVAALVALFCYGTYYVEESRFARVVEKYNAAAAKAQTAAVDEARRAEGAVAKLNDTTEVIDANDKRNRATELRAARAHAAHFGGLRDPGVQTCATSGPAAPASRASRDSGASRQGLSQEATDFLLQLAGDADSVYDQLRLCQGYAVKLRAVCVRDGQGQ